MKINPSVQKTAWASLVLLVVIGLITTITGVVNPYRGAETTVVMMVLMIMTLPVSLLLFPGKPEAEERIVYRHTDERAPEGFDTQA